MILLVGLALAQAPRVSAAGGLEGAEPAPHRVADIFDFKIKSAADLPFAREALTPAYDTRYFFWASDNAHLQDDYGGTGDPNNADRNNSAIHVGFILDFGQEAWAETDYFELTRATVNFRYYNALGRVDVYFGVWALENLSGAPPLSLALDQSMKNLKGVHEFVFACEWLQRAGDYAGKQVSVTVDGTEFSKKTTNRTYESNNTTWFRSMVTGGAVTVLTNIEYVCYQSLLTYLDPAEYSERVWSRIVQYCGTVKAEIAQAEGRAEKRRLTEAAKISLGLYVKRDAEAALEAFRAAAVGTLKKDVSPENYDAEDWERVEAHIAAFGERLEDVFSEEEIWRLLADTERLIFEIPVRNLSSLKAEALAALDAYAAQNTYSKAAKAAIDGILSDAAEAIGQAESLAAVKNLLADYQNRIDRVEPDEPAGCASAVRSGGLVSVFVLTAAAGLLFVGTGARKGKGREKGS